MGFLATDIAKIPSDGFNWYVFILQDGWKDALRNEIADNFDHFAAAVGPECLAIRGTDPYSFYNQVVASELMKLAQGNTKSVSLPALIVSNRTPAEIGNSAGSKDMSGVRVMLFPLDKQYLRPGAITKFLKHLAATLKDGSINDMSEGVDKKKVRSKWRWLTNYLELKPNFFGVGVNFNAVLEEMFNGSMGSD